MTSAFLGATQGWQLPRKVLVSLGYSAWGEGQLENELKHDTWLVTTVEGEILGKSDGVGLWRQILGSIDPDLKLQAGEPEDPTVN